MKPKTLTKKRINEIERYIETLVIDKGNDQEVQDDQDMKAKEKEIKKMLIIGLDVLKVWKRDVEFFVIVKKFGYEKRGPDFFFFQDREFTIDEVFGIIEQKKKYGSVFTKKNSKG